MALAGQLSWEHELTTKISPEYIVTQSNRLIETPQDLNLQERRIILTLASLIQPEDDNFRLHRIRVKDLADILGIQEKNYYRKVKDIVVGLQQKMIRIMNDDKELFVNWLSSSEYHHGEGIVELEFSIKLRPFLVQLQKEYTPFKLHNVLRLRSEYSMRMYELLKQYEKLHKREMPYAELRYLLAISEDKYTQYGHFKDKVLNKAKDELKEKTDISFTFDEIKRGRKVTGFIFHIKSNTQVITEVVNQDTFKDDPYGLLIRFGIRPQVAKEITLKYGKQHILENVRYSVEKRAEKDIDNMGGYIIKTIENNYAEVPDDEILKDIPSMDEINNRISSISIFVEQKVKEGLITKEQAKTELKDLSFPLFVNLVQKRREYGLQPLKETLVTNPAARQAYRVALKQNK